MASRQTSTKANLLERIEYLWNESLDGLEVSKEPIRITKPDGSTVELRASCARVGFIREARSVLELQGAATGELVKGQSNQIGQVVIVIPATLQAQNVFRSSIFAGKTVSDGHSW